MSNVTIAPLPDPRWPELKPITLNNPTQEQLSDIIKTFSTNGIKYKIIYGMNEPFKYSVSPTSSSR